MYTTHCILHKLKSVVVDANFELLHWGEDFAETNDSTHPKQFSILRATSIDERLLHLPMDLPWHDDARLHDDVTVRLLDLQNEPATTINCPHTRVGSDRWWVRDYCVPSTWIDGWMDGWIDMCGTSQKGYTAEGYKFRRLCFLKTCQHGQAVTRDPLNLRAHGLNARCWHFRRRILVPFCSGPLVNRHAKVN